MRVKAAYYLRQMPTKIAVVLPDGRARIADLVPWRKVQEAELQELAALNHSSYRAEMLCDEMPEYAYKFYGLEKERVEI